jgi:hypothetical protein
MKRFQSSSSSQPFPTDPVERAHWRRSGRYLPQLDSTRAAHQPPIPGTIRLASLDWHTYWQLGPRFLLRPSSLFTASVVMLVLGLAPELQALQEGTAHGGETGSPVLTAEATPPAVDAPQAVDVEAETSLSQQFRLAPIPQWSVFEDMLNELGRTGQFLQGNTVEPVAQVTSPETVEGSTVVAGDDRRGENLERAELFSAAMTSANLFEGNFVGANLFAGTFTSANAFASGLQAANLYAAKFDEANLYESDLREANLFKTDLREANLYRADLTGANLFGADLAGANLFGANLEGANVVKANVDEALLCNTTMPDGSISDRDCAG